MLHIGQLDQVPIIKTESRGIAFKNRERPTFLPTIDMHEGLTTKLRFHYFDPTTQPLLVRPLTPLEFVILHHAHVIKRTRHTYPTTVLDFWRTAGRTYKSLELISDTHKLDESSLGNRFRFQPNEGERRCGRKN